MSYRDWVAGAESGNDPYAVNRLSGATGLFQFMPDTWASVQAQMGGNADIRDPAAQESAFRFLTEQNRQYLRNHLGRDANDQETYFAHVLGAPAASHLLANPDAPLGESLRTFYRGARQGEGFAERIRQQNPNLAAIWDQPASVAVARLGGNMAGRRVARAQPDIASDFADYMPFLGGEQLAQAMPVMPPLDFPNGNRFRGTTRPEDIIQQLLDRTAGGPRPGTPNVIPQVLPPPTDIPENRRALGPPGLSDTNPLTSMFGPPSPETTERVRRWLEAWRAAMSPGTQTDLASTLFNNDPSNPGDPTGAATGGPGQVTLGRIASGVLPALQGIGHDLAPGIIANPDPSTDPNYGGYVAAPRGGPAPAAPTPPAAPPAPSGPPLGIQQPSLTPPTFGPVNPPDYSQVLQLMAGATPAQPQRTLQDRGMEMLLGALANFESRPGDTIGTMLGRMGAGGFAQALRGRQADRTEQNAYEMARAQASGHMAGTALGVTGQQQQGDLARSGQRFQEGQAANQTAQQSYHNQLQLMQTVASLLRAQRSGQSLGSPMQNALIAGLRNRYQEQAVAEARRIYGPQFNALMMGPTGAHILDGIMTQLMMSDPTGMRTLQDNMHLLRAPTGTALPSLGAE